MEKLEKNNNSRITRSKKYIALLYTNPLILFIIPTSDNYK